jgi:ribosomal protein L16 Arg81 hydroxylase
MSVIENGAPSTLAELVSPLSEAEFLGLLRRREMAYRPGSKGDHYAPFLGWAALRDILAAGRQPLERDGIRVTKESHVMPPEKWTTDGKVDTSKLQAFLADGFSIVITHVEAHVPALAAVCNEIKTRLHDGSFVGAIVTAGAGAGAFKVHFDPEDLVILQIEGTKRWQVFAPVVSNPLRAMPKQTLENPQPILDEVLEPGDLLFVPGGYWHHCESGLSASVHLGVFFLPPTGWHAIREIVRTLISDELFRTPLTRLEDQARFDAIEQEIKNRTIEKINALKLADFVARWNME